MNSPILEKSHSKTLALVSTPTLRLILTPRMVKMSEIRNIV